MKYFVTGATGFIGGRVVRQLIQAGHDVTALVRNLEKAQDLKHLGVRLAQGDITDKASLKEPMTGADGVFHMAAWYKVGEKNHQAHRINVDGTRHVLETMRDLAIPKGVYTSTVAVFSDTRGRLVDETYQFQGRHLSEYDRTKWEAHYRVARPMMEEGLPLVIVQPGAVYGPGDTSGVGTAFRDYLNRKLPMLIKGTALCWGHVEDTARGHLLAMEKGTPGESYIIAGPSHPLTQVFDWAEELTGIPAPGIRLSPAMVKGMSRVMGVLGGVLPLPPAYTAEGLRVVAGVTYLGDNAKARRELGFDPRPLKEGMLETLNAMMNEKEKGQ